MIAQLRRELANSDSKLRKHRAQQIIDEEISLESLLPLLHLNNGTSQRFMWLIGDICELDPKVVEPCLAMLFSLHDQMSFPGMPRSIAKWLLITNVPGDIEKQATKQLLGWLGSDSASIACKSYSAKTLFSLVAEKRLAKQRLKKLLLQQAQHPNRAYAGRIRKLLIQLASI